MLNLLKLILCKDKNLPAEKTQETKKCMHCLRRVDIQVSKCPHCRKEGFLY